jgi:phenylpropionate dioxygenase-like ring-hydroxylating dioxygenase large terminal subunit
MFIYNAYFLYPLLTGILFLAYKTFTLKRTNKNEAKNHTVEDYIKSTQDLTKNMDPLQMENYWYPILFSKDLKDDKPHGTKIFGEPIVLYRTKDNKVVCAQDVCPHRSSKLSIGKVKDGVIECPYHGWQFEEKGQCKKIPSVKEDSSMPKLVCLTTKPCIEEMGMIFIWPGNPKLADEKLIPRHMFREREWEGWDFSTENIDIDLPQPIMIENVLDYSHIDFVHDGSIGKRKNASYIECVENKESIYAKLSKNSFQFDLTKPKDGGYPIVSVIYVPPCFVRIEIEISKGKWFHQIDCYVPIEKNKTRVILSFHQTMIPLLITDLFINTKLGQYYSVKTNRKILKEDIDIISTVDENIKYKKKPFSKIVVSDAPIKKYREECWNQSKIPWFNGFDIEDIVL